jgi:protein-S-isoprenylcysteine O-methyltransferase Ste14
MNEKLTDLKRLWKFYFWIIVWAASFAPSLFYTDSLRGGWLLLSRVLGILLLLYSLFLTSTGGRTLARFAHQEGHEHYWPDKFTEFGIFGCMRHSMHMGLAFFPLSLALLSGRIYAIAAAGWSVAAALWFVLVIEEKETLEKYGTRYTDYMQRVPPFSLKLDCLRAAMKIWKHSPEDRE